MGFSLGGLRSISAESAHELSRFCEQAPSWFTEIDLTFGSEYWAEDVSHDFSGLDSMESAALASLASLNGHLDLGGLKS